MYCLLFIDIEVEFNAVLYTVDENNGPAQPVLILSQPLDCCPISVTIEVEHITTNDGIAICNFSDMIL